MLQVQSQEDSVRLICQGDVVCGAECEALQAALAHLLDSNRGHVVVDLYHVRKLDCAGLGIFADAAKRARLVGKSLELVNIPAAVQKMLRATKLEQELTSGTRPTRSTSAA